MNVCDECLLVAYDEGIYDGEEQARVMVEMGADVQDHTCESVEEPDITCFCGCRDAKVRCTSTPKENKHV